MKTPTMSKAALTVKRHYYNVERWENKAKKTYGKNYIPAKPGEEISEQALKMRRDYCRYSMLKKSRSISFIPWKQPILFPSRNIVRTPSPAV